MPQMRCPHCQAEDLNEDARYCYNCGRPVGLAARIDIRQDVERNLGNVIGVKTDVIQGDVYGGDIYQVQFYALSADSRKPGGADFLAEYTSPYKFLAPYSLRDRRLFKGREDQVRQALQKIGEGRLLVLYGAPGVGKTSLIAAGIIPELIEAGAMAVHIRDYNQPLGRTLRQTLAASREQFPLELPEDADLPTVIKAVQAAAEGTLVLFLDQFESVLSPVLPPDQRAGLMQEISQSLMNVSPEFLRLVLVVPDDPTIRLADFHQAMPEVLTSLLEIRPLNREQAEQAILEPLGKPGEASAFPVYYESGLVSDALVLELDSLTEELPGYIYPPYLQIVCYRLYELGLERNPPVITRDYYLGQLRGANGILARYLNETLEKQFTDERALAQQILVMMLSPGVEEWVVPESINIQGVTLERIQDVLTRLKSATFLIQKNVDGQVAFALANEVVEREVLNLAGEEIVESRRAGMELERIYAAWLSEGELADEGQLQRLADHGRHLSPWPVKRLLLLRSAAAYRQPLEPWVDWLRYDLGRAFLRQISGLQEEELPQEITLEQIQEGKRILEVVDENGTDLDIPEGKPYRRLAWAAVNALDPSARQAGALSLLAIDPYTAEDRLKWALLDGPGGLMGIARQAEVYGALVEADPDFERLTSERSPLRRAAVWGWRAWRRIAADWERLFLLTLSTALAAGFFSGVWRVIAALHNGRVPGANATPDAVFGALLAGSLVLGKLLADHLLLRPSQPPLGQDLRNGVWFPVLLGGLGFGLMHTFITFSLGYFSFSGTGLIVSMGFAAGLALSTILSARPLEQLNQGGKPVLRALAVGLSFAAVHGVFVLLEEYGRTLAVVWPGAFYRAGNLSLWRSLNLVEAEGLPSFGFPNLLATIDAFAIGVALSLGVIVGLRIAVPILERWRLTEN